jgi:DNA-directed RNA polymerase specialized sigma24 family protein
MSTMEDSDEALVGRYVRGDATAFDQLYKRHELRVWRYLERNMRNQASSDELLQEIWFALSRNAVSLESAPRFRTRLFTLTHDRMSNALRERPPAAAPEATGGRLSRDPAGLARAIAELPREQREAFLLQAEGQLSIGEIAEITEASIDATQSTLRQAKLQLRAVLGEGEVPANPDDLGDVEQLYRRLSGIDAGRPGEWVRRKVQAYSAQQAAERSVRDSSKASVSPVAVTPAPAPRVAAPAARPAEPKQSTSRPWLLPVIGAAVVVALVGIFVVPSLLGPGAAAIPPPPPPPVVEPAAATEAAQTTPSPSETTPPSASQSSEPEVASSPAQASPPPAAPAPTPAREVAQTAPAENSGEARPSAPSASAPASGTAASHAQALTKAKVVAHQNVAPPAPAAVVAKTQAAPIAAPVSNPAPTPVSVPVQASAAPTPPPAAPVAVASVAQPAPTPVSAASAAPARAMPPPDDFYRAAETGNMGRVQEVLADGNVDLNTRDPKGRTALILAIQRGQVDVVKALLAHGANPTEVDSRGETPKVAAQSRGNFEIIQAVEKATKH